MHESLPPFPDVEHLGERLSGDVDGKPKVFRDTVVTNLTEFFDRFRTLNVRSNDQLDDLVKRAQRVMRGVEPQQLKSRQRKLLSRGDIAKRDFAGEFSIFWG